MLNPTFVKLIAYYDNEWAYSTRMVSVIFSHDPYFCLHLVFIIMSESMYSRYCNSLQINLTLFNLVHFSLV